MLHIPNKADASYPRQAGGFGADMDTFASALAGDGVVDGMGVSAQITPDMTVAVAGGLARIAGYYAYVAAQNVTIAAADSSNPRFDLIVSDYNGTVSRVAGTAAAAAVPPAVPANSLQLAQVYVPASVTAITNAMIVDKRPTVVDFFDLSDDFTSQASVASGGLGAHRGHGWYARVSGCRVGAPRRAAPGHRHGERQQPAPAPRCECHWRAFAACRDRTRAHGGVHSHHHLHRGQARARCGPQ
jgi:hypothetical protein